MQMKTPEVELRLRTMEYVIRDEDTDEITGLHPDAPPEVVEDYNRMMDEMNSLEPIVR